MDLTASYLDDAVIPPALRSRYGWAEVRNAAALLAATNPVEFGEVLRVLDGFSLTALHLTTPGGNKGLVARELDGSFRELGWRETRHDITITSVIRVMPYREAGETAPIVTTTEIPSEAYKVDNVKGRVAVDVEWNAKDGNLDRDLAGYRALYEAGVLDGAVIVTRTQADLVALQDSLGHRTLNTTTTTNLDKVIPRMTRGDAGGCPLLVVAISAATYAEPPGQSPRAAGEPP